ncbi:hypothetical protein VTO73DRAFT_11216 [Trametes versicolor]
MALQPCDVPKFRLCQETPCEYDQLLPSSFSRRLPAPGKSLPPIHPRNPPPLRRPRTPTRFSVHRLNDRTRSRFLSSPPRRPPAYGRAAAPYGQPTRARTYPRLPAPIAACKSPSDKHAQASLAWRGTDLDVRLASTDFCVRGAGASWE